MRKKALVIGSSVSKSLSPLIFNYWFKKHKIDGLYEFREINLKYFDKQIKEILEDNQVCGFNVTIPFKELIKEKINFADIHSEEIGAINCVSNIGGKWRGANTDWIGFYKSVEKIINQSKKETALVLGYGGASKAILYSLKKLKFKKIKIYNRTMSKIKHLEKNDKFLALEHDKLNIHIDSSDIVINTTPTNILEKILKKDEQKNILAYDVVYRPKETDFLSYFKKNKRIYGISMLVHQAAPCFEKWFGVRPTIDSGLYSFLDKNSNQ